MARVVLAEQCRLQRDVDAPHLRAAHLAGNSECDRPGAGCHVDGDALSPAPAQRLDCLLCKQLARRTGDEDAVTDEQVESAKRVVALDARNRLAVDASRNHRRVALLRRSVEHAVEQVRRQRSAEHLGHQLLGVVPPEVAVPVVDRLRFVDLANGFLDVFGDGDGWHCPRMVSARSPARARWRVPVDSSAGSRPVRTMRARPAHPGRAFILRALRARGHRPAFSALSAAARPSCDGFVEAEPQATRR